MSSSFPSHIRETFQGKKILITGASGYLSTNLIHSLKCIDCTVIRLSRKDILPPLEGKANIIDHQGDIGCGKTWNHVLEDVDIVYHLAGQTSVYVANEKPLADMDINVKSMLLLLETCRTKGINPAIIFSATSTEMGIPTTLPVNESCADQPVTFYDLHKLMAENYLMFYCRLGYVQGTSLRLTNVYGPGPLSSNDDRGVLNKIMRNALTGKPLTIYGEGNYIRDYIYIEDVVSALLSAPAHLPKTTGRYFLIGNGNGHSISQTFHLVANKVTLKTGKRVLVENIDPPPNLSPIEERNFVADTTAFKEAAGWVPQYSLEKGVDMTLENFSSLTT